MNIKKLMLLPLLLSQFIYANDVPLIFIEGGKLHYDGPLTKEGVLKFKETYKASSTPIKWVELRSQGGEINTGMELGEFIFRHSLNISVNDYCFSSCANYVFTSAKKKLLTKHALIGFHGGAASSTFGTSEMETQIMTFPKEQRESVRKALYSQLEDYLTKAKNREKSFFDRLGINVNITTYGQQGEYKSFMQSGDYVGWYYPIADLNKLGVRDIEVTNAPWQPTAPKGKLKIYMVTVGN